MRSSSACFDELRTFCEEVPLVDCHDHSGVCGPKYTDPIQAVIGGYFPSDIHSASSDAEQAVIHDQARPLAERWAVLEKAWKRSCHTGYARVTRMVLKRFYEEDDLTLDALERIKDKLLDLEDATVFEGILDEANIAVRILDIWPDVAKVLDGSLELTPRGRLVISLPGYHGIRCRENVDGLMAPLGRTVTSLDEYLDGCRAIFEGHKAYGVVAFKDQSAYSRTLAYDNPSRAEAERVFNWFMDDPRRCASYPDGCQPLDDFLFHEFMRMARHLDLPVQIHTGHMAGIRNDIAKTNAIGLTRVIELHRDVRFDLFHANWPYNDELVYLAKNFPNVTMDFCWTNIIDPVYCQALFKQALSAVPHGKVHAYGSDFGGSVERAWAHAAIARDNVAIALSEMVDMQYLDLDEAKEVAHAWLFDNANTFFRLGL
ncbi:MAG: amidohydrolase family protein [Nitrospiraceae bacterium]|nr:amidohydrolase family protein [Nitrospiraceae bacterium]